MRAHLIFGLVIITLSLVFLGCGDDVGGHCFDSRDCDGHCETGKDFPGGLCTYGCASNADCPQYWICAKKSGGICLETCPERAYCRSAYGPDWTCRDQDYNQGGGKTKVCLGD